MDILKKEKLKKKYFGYLEGTIYILLTVFVIFTAIAGPIMIKLIPFIFVLGIVGRTIYDRPIITAIFGFIVSVCIIYILGAYSFAYNLMYSLFCFICILMGEVAGMYLIRLIDKKRKKKTFKKNIVALLLLLIAGFCLNSYVNGNIFSYLNSMQTLKDYIALNYSDSSNTKIYGGKYVINQYSFYSFKVKNIDVSDEKTYEFAVFSDNKVIDGYENSRLASNSKILKNKFLNKFDFSKYTSADINIDIKYSDLKNNITIIIAKKVNKINSDELNNFSNDVNNILDEISTFDEFSKISKMNISLSDNNYKTDADIYSTNFYDKEYYIDSLDIEYLDE